MWNGGLERGLDIETGETYLRVIRGSVMVGIVYKGAVKVNALYAPSKFGVICY